MPRATHAAHELRVDQVCFKDIRTSTISRSYTQYVKARSSRQSAGRLWSMTSLTQHTHTWTTTRDKWNLYSYKNGLHRLQARTWRNNGRAQIPDASQTKCRWRRLMRVGPQYSTRFMSPFRRLEIFCDLYIFEIFLRPCCSWIYTCKKKNSVLLHTQGYRMRAK